MKIAIIGGGIAGCAAYLELQKHLPMSGASNPHEIVIYEPYDIGLDITADRRLEGSTHSSTLLVGGGLGVAPNGLRVLKRLDEELLQDVSRVGYVTNTSNMKTKNSWPLFSMSSSCSDNDTENPRTLHTVATSRHAFWRALCARVPPKHIVKKRICKIQTDPCGRNTIYFADGTLSVDADLVIGADGVKSTTKRALFPEAGADPYPPHYEGLVGVGGFISSAGIKELVEPGSMNFIFGVNVFFGYFFSESAESAPKKDSPYDVSDPGESLAWWSTYEIEKCPTRETLDMEDVTRQLRERHANWREPVVQRIIQSLHVEKMYPTWTSPSLPTWGRDGVILIGDAAHALPPSSGQGSSQALEDAEALALFLAHYLRNGSGDESEDVALSCKRVINAAAKSYTTIRQPRVKGIMDFAQKTQNGKREMGVLKEYSIYGFMKIMGLFPNLMTGQIRKIVEYDIADQVSHFLGSKQ
ncbi:unnamed protein product [Penicillium salamii]|uniref:FAD-binding domain-containing protein n=1 Tax=Penicillium salamii TaxID=1612424 RepID=A0A9W4NH48_9EURO|nr:unnamed protein product [Penicillium salamii]CAG8356202.1 unnamed protein product [Penicillium salamii]CAG8369070.1 unnamed protein product [Penicillium salamii]CAG8394033.1 unnamed protein product [Penicillium salamii]